MCDVRLYTVRVDPVAGDRCDGCGAPIAPHAVAVIRGNDKTLFCSHQCAQLHDGIPLEPRAVRIAS